MDKLERIRDRVKTAKDQVGRIMKEIIEENEAFIIDANAYFQLEQKGVNKLGIEISEYAPYAAYTVWRKLAKGQPTDRVTLKDTGDFHSSFYVVVDEEGFEIMASDEKTEALVAKYGKDIFGLTDEHMKILVEDYIKPELVNKLLEYIDG